MVPTLSSTAALLLLEPELAGVETTVVGICWFAFERLREDDGLSDCDDDCEDDCVKLNVTFFKAVLLSLSSKSSGFLETIDLASFAEVSAFWRVRLVMARELEAIVVTAGVGDPLTRVPPTLDRLVFAFELPALSWIFIAVVSAELLLEAAPNNTGLLIDS
uniref:Putative secreted protein n=1 Tax=Anopheles triannulatus TaxID=58253 RepID=A0A2M4B1X2_9DIPT